MSSIKKTVGKKVAGPERNGALGRAASDLIGAALREHFEDIARAPVPDKFLLLLAELEAKEQLQQSAEVQPKGLNGKAGKGNGHDKS